MLVRERELAAHDQLVARNRRIGAARPFVPIEVPTNFSFVKNTEQILRFFDSIHEITADGNNVELDLSGIGSLSYDAVIVLLSRIRDNRFINGMSVRGNEPNDPTQKQLLRDSGFYDYVPHAASLDLPRGQRMIRNKKAFDVESETTAQLIEFATTKLTGKPMWWKGVQRTFVECMCNTKDHASRSARHSREAWWASVYVDSPNRRAQFSFLDNGVGILRSVELKPILSRALHAVGLADRTLMLRELLEGQIGSRTGLPYRGKGLPAIRETESARGLTENLVIVTNDVYAEPGRNVYRRMKGKFEGSFFYWEKGAL